MKREIVRHIRPRHSTLRKSCSETPGASRYENAASGKYIVVVIIDEGAGLVVDLKRQDNLHKL